MKRFLMFFPLLALVLAACANPAPAEDVTVRIAVIPVIDTLPMFVAESEGLYAKLGVKVELIPVASAPERDQLLQAGQADGTLNELLSVMFFNRESVQMQAVRYGHMASQGAGHFFLLASGQSGITDVEQLKGVEIGISQGTIIEYLTDRLLEAEGFTSADIKYVAVPKIPDRMALLASGELKAAVMPDPLGGLAVQQGAVVLLDDTSYPLVGASVISFRKEFIEKHPVAVKAFLAAIEEAVTLINSEPTRFGALLAEKKIVPPPLVGTYNVPKFPLKGVSSEDEWNDVLAWARGKGLLQADISYKDSVNSSFLP